jgi:aryl-alcohol dehydrogenase-like predicted oxidoreductase
MVTAQSDRAKITRATELPTTPLGTTGMQITRIGFGACAIDGGWQSAWGSRDDAESVRAIHRAVEHGVNWIDTAAVYGLAHSEEVVARALRDIPASDRPYVFTKCGLVWDPRHLTEALRAVGNPASIRREVEASLRRLRVDRIDLYQVHWAPQDGTPLCAYWQTLLALKAEGKVRAVGLSNHDLDQLTIAENIGHVDTLEPPFSAIRRRAAASELPWCADHHTGVIVYNPMQSGLLSGSLTFARVATLGAGDWRSRSDDFNGAALSRNLALAAALRPIAERYDTTVGAVAIAWTLAWRGVTAAIVDARSAAQVDGWLRAGTLVLSEADMIEIATAIRRTGAGAGPIMPADLAADDMLEMA